MNVFDLMGKFWVEIADRNQTNRQLSFLKSNLTAKGAVLDLACGSGRHLIGLEEAGYAVVGLDISLKLLKIAKSRFSGAQLVRGDMRFLPFKPDVFTAAVSMDTSLGYLTSEKDDLQSLRDLQRCIVRGGLFVVDVFNREHLVKQYGAGAKTQSWEYPSFILEQTRIVDADGGKLRDLWLVHDRADGQTRVFEHVARLYSLEGLQGLLEKVGFAVKAVWRL